MKFVKREYFDPNVMKALLIHNGLPIDEKNKLKKYYKRRYNGNCVEVVYDFSKDYASSKIGRIYADKGIGLQFFDKNSRNALARENYWDVDVENAHATILLKICQDNGWRCDVLQKYVENREAVLNDAMIHYGATRQDVKNLFIRMMFLGHPESWIGETTCDNSETPMPLVLEFKRELQTIARNVWGVFNDISDIVNKKRKIHENQKLSSCLSLKLQTEEHKILMCIDECLKQQKRDMDVFMFDGGLVRKLKNEEVFNNELLRICECYVMDKTGYKIKLVVKPMLSNLDLNVREEKRMIDPNIIIDDVFASKQFVKLMGDNIIYTDDCLYVFDDTKGLWTSSQVIIKQCVIKFENELKFHQVDSDSGKIKLYNYSGNEKNMNNMLKNVAPFCLVDDFFGKFADTSRGKLLFADGIYDFDTNTFSEEFNNKIVFKYRIAKAFPKERNDKLIKYVHKILFIDPFMDYEKVVSDFLRVAIARSIYGDYRSKRFYFCVGKANGGKSAISDAIINSFEGFVGTFNAGALVFNENSGSDLAKKLSWVFGIKDKRMAISNEVSMNKSFDGNILKMLASGGDVFDARTNFKDEVKVINRSTMFCFINDIPNINPNDDAVKNRVKCIEYNCVFVDGEVSQDFERPMDKTIKDKFKDVEYQNAFIHIILDAYQEFLRNGHHVPEEVNNATKEWTGDTGSVEGALRKKYEITRNVDDFVKSRDILDFLQKNQKIAMSDKKISNELKSLKLVNGDKKLNGKTFSVWKGIKEIDDDDYMIDDDID